MVYHSQSHLFPLALALISVTFKLSAGRLCESGEARCNPSPPTISDCPSAQLYSAPDDCGCLHWYCNKLSATDLQSACPSGWNRYVNSDGVTICIRVFNETAPWEQASWACDGHFNSDLLNIRQIELLTKDTPLFTSILRDLETATAKDRVWCGLHVTENKLYWDGSIPTPDRDFTPDSNSLVRFLHTHWRAVKIGRTCMSYQASSFTSDTSRVFLNPEYCISGLPFVCSKIIPADTATYYKPKQDFLCGGKTGWQGSLDNDFCYKYFSNLLSFDDAEEFCASAGGKLADPRSLINQRFLGGILSGMENGTAPLAIHVGMKQTSADGITFTWGGTVNDANILRANNIFSSPSRANKCGIFWNPYYAEGRSAVNAVQFDKCSARRPFICSSKPQGQSIAGTAKLNLTMDGYLLTCKAEGINVDGKIVWKKDHQYFAVQPLTSNITLNEELFRKIIDDDSNRTITHGDYSGQYQCEFWQTYPKSILVSNQLSVTFNDSVNLRLSDTLEDVKWSQDLEGFNFRVSHQDEMTDDVKRIQQIILAKVRESLASLDQNTLKYDVNILWMRESPDGKVTVEYRVQITGKDVAQSQASNSNTTDLLYQVVKVLSTGDSIEGQFLCLEKSFIHPETKENFTLPYSANGRKMEVNGLCHGQRKVMLTADCTYENTLKMSIWKNIRFANCTTDCLADEFIHPKTSDTYRLPTARVNDIIILNGTCGDIEQGMVRGVCKRRRWEIEALSCVLACPPLQLEHPQFPGKVPDKRIPIGKTFSLNKTCSKENKTVLTAVCQRGSDGAFYNITHTEMCNLHCPEKLVSHKVGLEWTFNRSFVNTTLFVKGMCDGREKVLVTAMCNGNIADGVSWFMKKAQCNAKCSPKTFVHPDTFQTVVLPVGSMGEFRNISINCNGRLILAEAECQGNMTNGLIWQMTVVPECSARCPATSKYDPFTDKEYAIPETDFNSQVSLKGNCGGKEEVIISAECTGNLSTGVHWDYESFNCTPSCDAMSITHNDTGINYTLPNRLFGESYSITGLCNNQQVVAVNASCGSRIEEKPFWTHIDVTPCTGICRKSFLRISDGRDVVLPEARIGGNTTIFGLCAGLNFSEVEAECIGHPSTGGRWKHKINKCKIDDTCIASSFAQSYTMEKLFLPRTKPGEVVHVKGTCQDEETVVLTATCVPRIGGNGVWGLHFTECDIDELSMLSNLLDNFRDNPKELAKLSGKLSENVTDPSTEFVSKLTGIVQHISDPETPKSVENEGGFFFDVINNMMGFNVSSLTSKGENETESSSNRIAKSIEGFLDSSSLSDPKIELFRENLYIQAINTNNTNSTEDNAPVQVVTDDVAVTLSKNITQDSKVTFVKYNSSVLFSADAKLLKDAVFSASIAGKVVDNTDSAITYTIEIDADSGEGEPTCVYWNFTANKWSTDGCETIERDNASITCSCVHLTNFAVLMDIQGQQDYIQAEHHLALSIISMTGLCISIVCLSLHLIAFLFIEKLRENQFQKVLANLVLAMLLSNLVFVTGITETSNEHTCIAVAALLHYFILASFAWMFVEALMQYRRFVKVFAIHVSHILIKAGIPAWLGPAVPVAIVFIVDPQLYRGGEKFCWMKPQALYYAFLIPIGGFIIANTILFSLLINGLICARSKEQLRTNKSETQLRNMYLKAALAVFVLLGLTWIFGFLAMSQHTRLVFQYLFCITNSFQGLAIFILHNIRDPKVLAWWRRVMRLKPKRALPSTLSSSKSNMTTTSIVVTDDEFNTAKSTKPLTAKKSGKVTLEVPQLIVPTDASKQGHLLQTKMYSSTESDTSYASAVTNTSDV